MPNNIESLKLSYEQVVMSEKEKMDVLEKEKSILLVEIKKIENRINKCLDTIECSKKKYEDSL